MKRSVLLAAAALLLLQAVLLGRMAQVTSPVLDELAHLASGLSHWEFGSFELYRVNPPLVRMIAAVPVLLAGVEVDWNHGWSDSPYSRAEFPMGRRLVTLNGEHSFWLFTIARWACIPFALLGGVVCFLWGRALYGDVAGLLSLAVWCVCPNVLAWGATICPDLPAASLGLLAGFRFWRWLQTPGGENLTLAGLSTGLALLTKSTWILLWGLWPLLWLFWRVSAPRAAMVSRPEPDGAEPDGAETDGAETDGAESDGLEQDPKEVAPERRPSLWGLAGLLLISVYVLNVGYGFAGVLQPCGSFEFISQALGGERQDGETGNRFRDTLLENCPSPLPADFVRGLDVQRYDFEQRKWSYLRGEHQHGGWWWYYLYALAVKTPVGTLALIPLALLCGWRRTGVGGRWRDEVVLLAPCVAVLLLVSSQTGFNRYLRYALPAVPFLFVWFGRLTLGWGTPGAGRRWVIGAGWVAVCLAAISSLRVWPYSMAYFNEPAGGPEGGHWHLLDANIDWGQGLLALRDWAADHPEATPLHLADFGWVAARFAGLETKPVPPLLFDEQGRVTRGNLAEVVPGWYAVSVNHLFGYRHYGSDRPVYTWLQEFEPVARPAHTFWVFHLEADDVARFQERHPDPVAAPPSPDPRAASAPAVRARPATTP